MMPEFGLDFETGASALYKTRVSERMSCEESAILFTYLAYTGCPVNWYSLSISIPDFSDCPIKKTNLQF